MAHRLDYFSMSGTTTTSTTVAEIIGSPVRGLAKYDWITLDASLAGVPGATLDVYVQRQIANSDQVTGGVWADWVHFAQLAPLAARGYRTIAPQSAASIVTVGRGTDASPGTPALAVNTSIGGHPGDAVRLVAKCGGDTLTGTSLSVAVIGWKSEY
jgi:hypothetical protein